MRSRELYSLPIWTFIFYHLIDYNKETETILSHKKASFGMDLEVKRQENELLMI